MPMSVAYTCQIFLNPEFGNLAITENTRGVSSPICSHRVAMQELQRINCAAFIVAVMCCIYPSTEIKFYHAK